MADATTIWSPPLGRGEADRLAQIIAAGRTASALSGWEQDFLLSLEDLLKRRGRGLRLTPPQADRLAEIEATMVRIGLVPARMAAAEQPGLL